MRDARDGIAAELKQRVLKQVVVAAKAGLTERQLSDIVTKRRKLDANEMLALCQVIGTTPNDLFGLSSKNSA